MRPSTVGVLLASLLATPSFSGEKAGANKQAVAGGLEVRIFEGDKKLTGTKTGKAILKLAPDQSEEQLLEIYCAFNYSASGKENKMGVTGKELYLDIHAGEKRKDAWERYIDAAESHNEPGKFTALS